AGGARAVVRARAPPPAAPPPPLRWRRRHDRDVVGSARHTDQHGPLRGGQLGIELGGGAGDLQLAQLGVAEIQVQVRRPAADLDRPWDLIGKSELDMTALSTEEMEGRKAGALADLQGAGLAVESDGRRILTTWIVDASLVERVTDTAGLDVDGGRAVIDVEARRAQAAELLRRIETLDPEGRRRGERRIRHRRDHDDGGRSDTDQGGLLAGEGVIE